MECHLEKKAGLTRNDILIIYTFVFRRNGTEYNRQHVTEREGNFRSAQLPPAVFHKIAVIFFDRLWIIRVNISSCWRSVPLKKQV
uniref:Uncharacterized protein n=1 Tax=Romanomermis culicivorax TaxID=13658 RepID=A0A915K8M8_ROMCU